VSHLEVETKFELSVDDFECLKALGRVAHYEEQLNVYYDAHWKLADNAVTLRIRFNDGSDPVLTLKMPISQTGTRRVMREFEIVLSRNEAIPFRSHHPMRIDIERELPDQLGEYLLHLGIRHVHRVGWVRNTRLVLEIENVGHIELDRLELPDGSVVHEVEIESDSESAHRRLEQIICLHAPHARPSSISKFQRFRHATNVF